MDATISSPMTPTAATSKTDLTVSKAVMLQLLPGIPMTITYFGLSAYFATVGLPNAFALFLAILFVEVPVSWWIMLRHVKAEGKALSFRALFPWGSKLRLSRLLGIGIPVAFLSVVTMFGLQTLIGEPLRIAFFSWMPEWAVYAMTPEIMMMLSAPMRIMFALLVLVSGVIVGTTTQELFARGFILPRIAHVGPLATVISAVSFAAMHFTSPWAWPVFATTALLWSALGYRFRSTALPVIGHVGMLGIMWLGMVMMLVG